MTDSQKLLDILMDELPEENPWEGEIRKLRDRLIANGVTVQGDKDINVPTKWISVKERLPDLELVEAKANVCDSYVCLTAKRGFANKDQIFIINAWYYGDRFENDDGIDITDDVTHWMPLPEPPKGE